MSAATSQVRQLLFRLDSLRGEGGGVVAGLCGITRAQGVSTSLARMAAECAVLYPERRLLLIDANAANPSLHTLIGCPEGPGLVDAVNGSVDSMQVVHRTHEKHVQCVPFGKVPKGSRSVFTSDKLAHVLAEWGRRFDMVLVDVPSCDQGIESLAVSRLCQRTIIMVSSERVHRKVAQHYVDGMRQSGCVLEGILLNRVRHTVPSWLYRRI